MIRHEVHQKFYHHVPFLLKLKNILDPDVLKFCVPFLLMNITYTRIRRKITFAAVVGMVELSRRYIGVNRNQLRCGRLSYAIIRRDRWIKQLCFVLCKAFTWLLLF